MYMYNVLFNFDKTDGLFSDTSDPNAYVPPIPFELRTSKHWLELVGHPGPSFDPETANWSDLGKASCLLLRNKPNEGDICIRVAPDKRGAVPSAAATLQLVVSFGRPVRFKQAHSSPFTHDHTSGGTIVTTFLLDPTGAPVPRNTSRGWFLTMGPIAKRPGHPSGALVHRYEFSLGVIVKEPATASTPEVVRHYGEDPEMDVGD